MSSELSAEQLGAWINGLRFDLTHPAIEWTPALLNMLLEIHLVRLLRDVIPDSNASMAILDNCVSFLNAKSPGEIEVSA